MSCLSTWPGIRSTLDPPLSLQKTLAILFDIFQHTSNAVTKYIYASVIRVKLQMIAYHRQQSIQSRAHTGRTTHQPHPLPAFSGSAGSCSFCQLLTPAFRLFLRPQTPASSALLFCCAPGCRSTTPAAIPPSLSAGVCKFLATPLTGFFCMRLIHSQQIAKPAAVASASLFSCQRRSTKRTFPCRRLL